MALTGKKIVFSGFRSDELKAQVEAQGGKVMTAVSGLTNYVVVKDVSKITKKLEEAKEKGAKIMQVNVFKSHFLAPPKTPSPKRKSPSPQKQSPLNKSPALVHVPRKAKLVDASDIVFVPALRKQLHQFKLLKVE